MRDNREDSIGELREMMVVRPVQLSDLDSLYALSTLTKVGLTTLPHDRGILRSTIEESIPNFEQLPSKPQGEVFLFVVEDDGEVVGTCSIFSKVGGFQPFWTYELKTQVNECAALGIRKEIQYLQLKADHNGPSEIGTLFLHPDYRVSNNGRLLSLSRFLFIAEFSQSFEDEILAEMRGVVDDEGNTVFWDAIGSRFFGIPYKMADAMVMKDKSFIDDLMPKHPIYIPLLPREARLVIGQTHPETGPALYLLQQEGFEYIEEVDIFEAGPVLKCATEKIRSVNESRNVVLGGIEESEAIGRNYLVARVGTPKEFRVVAATLHGISEGSVRLSSDVAGALEVGVGDRLRVSPLRKREKR